MATAVVLGTLALAACGGKVAPQSGPATTKAAETSTTTQTSTGAATTTTSPATTTQNLTSIAFFDPTTGYGVFQEQGSGGCGDAVGQTSDGGSTFTDLVPVTTWSCGSGAPVHALAFDDHGDGFLYGPGLFVTHDGGHSWTPGTQADAVLAVEALGSSIWMLETGCPASHPGSFGPCHMVLVESTDGGRTWAGTTSLPADALFNGSLPEGSLGQTWLVRVSQSSAYVLSTPVASGPGPDVAPLWFTDDGGSSWSSRHIPCAIGALSIVLSAAPDGTLFAVCATEPGAGYQPKSALRSTDGGLSWTTESLCLPGPLSQANCVGPFSNGYLGEIDATSSEQVFLVGDRSSLLVTNDGGVEWQVVDPPIGGSDAGTDQVIFFNTSDGVVLGQNGNNDEAWTIWQTSDDGAHWTTVVPRTS